MNNTQNICNYTEEEKIKMQNRELTYEFISDPKALVRILTKGLIRAVDAKFKKDLEDKLEAESRIKAFRTSNPYKRSDIE